MDMTDSLVTYNVMGHKSDIEQFITRKKNIYICEKLKTIIYCTFVYPLISLQCRRAQTFIFYVYLQSSLYYHDNILTLGVQYFADGN